jgi:hypothetical protein
VSERTRDHRLRSVTGDLGLGHYEWRSDIGMSGWGRGSLGEILAAEPRKNEVGQHVGSVWEIYSTYSNAIPIW